MDHNIIYHTISNLLRPKDNATRQQAENTLLSLYQIAPEETVNAYIDILEIETQYPKDAETNSNNSYLVEFHRFISLQLKICLSKSPRHPYQPLWHKLSQNTQQRVKQTLCSILQQKQKSEPVRYIAEIIGNLASHIIQTDDHNWPQLSHFIMQLAMQQQPTSLYCAFLILQSFYIQQLQNHKDIIPNLPQLFLRGFLNNNIEINYSALKCLGSYLLVLDHNRHKQFQHLIPSIFKVVCDLLAKGNTKGLNILFQCLDLEPKFFKSSFIQLLQFFQQINDSDLDESIKNMATNALFDFSLLSPSLFRNNSNAVNLMIDMIIMRMLVLPQNITESWMVPQQGFNLSCTDQPQLDIIHTNLHLLNKFIKEVGQDYVLERIKQNVDKLLNYGKWTYIYVAVAIISQLGEYVSDIDDLKRYISLIFELFKHQNPKIRFVAVHAIGMIAQQRKRDVNSRYARPFIQNMSELLMRQPCPRVVSHIWGALANLLNGFSYQHLKPFFPNLLATLIDCLVNGISIVKQCALSALSQLVGSSYESQEKSIMYHLPLLLRTISQYFYNQEYLTPAYNYLRGIALQNMSSVALIIGREQFRLYLRPFVSTILRLQSQSYNNLIPPHHFIISAWTRLGYAFGSQLQEYIHAAMPSIIQLILNDVRNHSTYQQEMNNDLEDTEQKLKQYGKQHSIINKQIVLGVKMIDALVEHLPSIASTYYEEIISIYVALMEHSPDEDLKQQVYKCLPTFISRLNTDAKQVETAVHFIDITIKSILKKTQNAMTSCKLKAIACMLGLFNIKILYPQLLGKLTQLLHTQLLSSNKQIYQIMMKSVDYDEDQIQTAQAQIKFYQDILQAVINVFTEVLQLYKKQVENFGLLVLREFIADIFEEGQRENRLKIGLFMLDDMIQHLGYDSLRQNWLWIQQILEKYTQSRPCSVRQAACYGLGILSKKYPNQLKTAQNAAEWMQLLHAAYFNPKQRKDSKTKYSKCLENIIAAMGKILITHQHLINIERYIDFWLASLPLKNDAHENLEMTNILTKLVESFPQVMCEHSKKRTLQLLKMLGSAKGTYSRNNQQLAELKKCLQIVSQSSIFMNNKQELIESLDQTITSKLEQLYDFEPYSTK